jgi:hypothetical protein
MKKTLLLALLLSSSSYAAVTLQFTITPNAAAGWANGTGASNAALVWGVVVDATGNGFGDHTFSSFDGGSLASGGAYDSGFSTTSNLNGIALNSTTAPVDDMLYIGTAKMSTGGAFDSATGLAKITSISNMVYSGSVAAGDNYAIIWFDQTTNGSTADGLKYGIYRESWMVLPADPGTYNVSNNFAGVEQLKTMNLTLGEAVPETSTSLLGALGALALLRRRRN